MSDKRGLVLTVSAMAVAAPRYAGAMAQAAGYALDGLIWFWIETVSGLGFAMLEAVVIALAARAWSDAPEGKTRNALGVLIVTTFALLALMVTPYIRATVSRVTVPDVLDSVTLWLWSLSVGVSPLFLMATSGVTDHTNKRNGTRNAARNVALRARDATVSESYVISKASRNTLKSGDANDAKQELQKAFDVSASQVVAGTEKLQENISPAARRQREYRARLRAKLHNKSQHID
jgi:hypothetical protein